MPGISLCYLTALYKKLSNLYLCPCMVHLSQCILKLIGKSLTCLQNLKSPHWFMIWSNYLSLAFNPPPNLATINPVSPFFFEVKWNEEKSLSCVWLFVTPGAVAYQAPLSMGLSRQEYWSGLPFPSPEDLPDPGIKHNFRTLQADALPFEPPEKADKWRRPK